jgi:hypothetical protein
LYKYWWLTPNGFYSKKREFTLTINAEAPDQRVKTGSNEGRPHFFPFLPAALAGAAAATGA